MIRATLSTTVLLGCLLWLSNWLQASNGVTRPVAGAADLVAGSGIGEPSEPLVSTVQLRGRANPAPLNASASTTQPHGLHVPPAPVAFSEQVLQQLPSHLTNDLLGASSSTASGIGVVRAVRVARSPRSSTTATNARLVTDEEANDDLSLDYRSDALPGEEEDFEANSDDLAENEENDSENNRAAETQDFEETEKLPLETESEPQEPLSPELEILRDKLHRCLDFYYTQRLNSRDDSAWSIMHAFISYGVDTEINMNSPNGRAVNAAAWLCWNGTCSGAKMLYTYNGKLRASTGPGVQGHAGQFLAILAQSRVMADYPIMVDGNQFTVADLVEMEKETCEPYSELTFKLIGLVHYLESDATWKDRNGRDWDIPRLIKEEIEQPINGATCGGTHRLMGLTYAVRKREQRHEPVTGQWWRAKKYIDDYHDYTFKLQNPDGSFSTSFFRGRGDRNDIDRRLETSGHILEWLICSLPKDQLRDEKVIQAVDYLTDLLSNNRYYRWSVGPKGHAIHALNLYDERVFGAKPGQRRVELANKTDDGSTER